VFVPVGYGRVLPRGTWLCWSPILPRVSNNREGMEGAVVEGCTRIRDNQ